MAHVSDSRSLPGTIRPLPRHQPQDRHRPAPTPGGPGGDTGLPWAMPQTRSRLRDPADGQEDLADGRTPARDDLLRSRGGRVLRRASASTRGRVLRLPLGRHGGGGGRHGDRHLLQLQPGAGPAAIPRSVGRTSPAAVLEARVGAAGTALARMLGEAVGSADMERAARRPAGPPSGPPTAAKAGRCSPPMPGWPGPTPPSVLWHAQTLLREFRGDGHITALVGSDLDPVEALVMHLASGEVPGTFLKGPPWMAGCGLGRNGCPAWSGGAWSMPGAGPRP